MKELSPHVQFELLEAMLDGSRVSAIVTDPSQPNNPIIYANKTFETMTGYASAEVIGRNCRFLQGADTDPIGVKQLRNGINNQIPVTAILKNHKKDGTLFWNRISIKPVTVEGQLFFTGTQTDVSVEYRQRAQLSEMNMEIEQLMFPILRIRKNLAAVSLVGLMTSDRFNFLTKKLTDFVKQADVDNIIIDITGLHESNDALLLNLYTIQDVLKLMGRNLYVTGISPQWAQLLIQKYEEYQKLYTFTSIQQAIELIR